MKRAVSPLVALSLSIAALSACESTRRSMPTHAAPHDPAPAPIAVPSPVSVPVPAPAATPPAPPDPSAACAAGEVYVPPTPEAGFLMGKGLRVGEHQVVLTRGFCMDASETTVREYAQCVDGGVCKKPWHGDPYSMYPKFPEHPVNMVSWLDARAYCAWVKKRLPTEAEWEWAATGPEQTKYVWGNEPGPSCERGDYTHWGAPKWSPGGDYGCHGGGPSAVGTHPLGDKIWPHGRIHDLAGNVWEWVLDSYAPWSAEKAIDPLVKNAGTVHPLRGGGWNRSYAAMEITYRAYHPEDYAVPAIGFRCVH